MPLLRTLLTVVFLRRKPRNEYLLCTKVGRLLRVPQSPQGEGAHYKGTPPERPVFDFSYDGVMNSVEESLKRLGHRVMGRPSPARSDFGNGAHAQGIVP